MRIGRGWLCAVLGGAFAWGWFSACKAYSGDEPPATESDASSDGGTLEGGGSDANAGPDADASPACVPGTIVVDAGEPSTCNGMAVDLTGNPDHCGFCNHRCPDGICVQGHCAVTEVAGSANTLYPEVTARGAALYFMSATYDGGVIGRYDPASDNASIVGSFDPGGGSSAALEVSEGFAFVIANGIGVLEVPLDGGAASLFASAPSATNAIAVDDGNLYWVHYADGLHRRPFDGGPDKQIYAGTFEDSVGGLVVDPAAVAFTVRDDGGPSSQMTLHVRPSGAGEKVLPGLVDVRATAMDADYIYFGDVNGRVSRLPKAGGSTVVEQVTAVSGPWLVPVGLAVDDTNVYFATNDGSTNGPFTIWQASKCGGTAHKLVDDIFIHRHLVSAGGYLYWTHSTAIARMAK